MWIYTTHGQLSVVNHFGDKQIKLVRSRNKQTLLRCRELAELDDVEIYSVPDSDYQWRMMVDAERFKQLLAALSDAMSYNNFKSGAQAAGEVGSHYIRHLHTVWADWYECNAEQREQRWLIDPAPNAIEEENETTKGARK